MDLTFKPIQMVKTDEVETDTMDQKTRVLVFAIPVTIQVELCRREGHSEFYSAFS